MKSTGGDTPRTLPWLRMLAEGTAIVASILLAFTIDAAWAARGDRIELDSVLQGLDEEFRDYVETLDRNVSRSDISLRQLHYLFIDPAAGSSEIPADSLDAAFWSVLYAPTLDWGRGTRDALVSSGRLEMLRNEELRARLAGWQAVVDELRDNQLAVRTYVLEVLVPFLSAQGIPLVRVLPVRVHPEASPEAKEPLPLPDLTPEVVRVYRRTVSDPEFQALLSYRYFWEASSSRGYREVLAAANRILALLDEETRR